MAHRFPDDNGNQARAGKALNRYDHVSRSTAISYVNDILLAFEMIKT